MFMYFPTTRKWTQREMIPKPKLWDITHSTRNDNFVPRREVDLCVIPEVLNLRTNGESFCAMCFCCNENRDRLRKVPSIREVSCFLKPDFFGW